MTTTAEVDLRRAFDGMGTTANPSQPVIEAPSENPAGEEAAPEAAIATPETTEVVAQPEEVQAGEEDVIELVDGKNVRFPNGKVMPVKEFAGYETLKSNVSRKEHQLYQERQKLEEERRRIQEDREFLDIAAKTPWIATGLQAIRTGADPKAAFKAAAIAGGYEEVGVAPQPAQVDQRSVWPPTDVSQEADPVEYEKRYAAHIEWKTEQAISNQLKKFEEKTLGVFQERDRKVQEAEALRNAQLQQAEATLKSNYERLTTDLFPYLPFDIAALDKTQQEQVFQKLSTIAADLGTPLDNNGMSQREYMPGELRYIAREAFASNPFIQKPIPGKPAIPPATPPLTPGQTASQTRPSTTGSSQFGDGVKELLSLQPV